MKKNTSYKEMLRNRVPDVVNLALKYKKAKTNWIEHVYDHFIGIYVMKDERYEATRILLGLSSKYRSFDFHKTIDWDSLDDEWKEYWEKIEEWVEWFKNNHRQIEDYITSCKNDKFTEEQTVILLQLKYKIDKDLATYLFKTQET